MSATAMILGTTYTASRMTIYHLCVFLHFIHIAPPLLVFTFPIVIIKNRNTLPIFNPRATKHGS